jgi:hypothetical protein
LIQEAQAANQKTQVITDANRKPGAPGSGGPGGGGGKGQGAGPGEGEGVGPGKMTKRAKRMQRWDISLGYDNTPEEYVRKLANLQAILLVPARGNEFRVYRDLSNRPLRGVIETRAEIDRLNRIYFVQRDEQHMESLAQILGLGIPPQYLAVFFPKGLEDELLRQELEHSGLTEDEIDQKKLATKFSAERRGGQWVVRVLEQKPRP